MAGKDASNEHTTVSCGESLDIRNVDEFRQQLKDALDAGAPVVMAADAVERADAAALQLLCAFFLDAKHKGIEVRWEQPAEALVSAASLLGVAPVGPIS